MYRDSFLTTFWNGTIVHYGYYMRLCNEYIVYYYEGYNLEVCLQRMLCTPDSDYKPYTRNALNRASSVED